jgi:pyrimidine-specific ribonucleoside hydrolase
LAVLTYPGIGVKRFVSKNVCHRVYYDQQMHERFRAVKDKSLSLALIYQGMDAYLQKKPGGNKFHDRLAACCAIDEQITTWAEVELYREGQRYSGSQERGRMNRFSGGLLFPSHANPCASGREAFDS